MHSSRRFFTPQRLVLLLCCALVIFVAIVPFYRATLRMEIKYNEGWNAYNAVALSHHAELYPVRYGWTMVNYPVLSFVTLAQLGQFTHDYLFTGRMLSLLSLLLCCLFAGIIVARLTSSARNGVLAGAFCLGVFCAGADTYVGMNDPQMFAQTFFMAALLVYVIGRDRPLALSLAALLIVAGGNIKHNLIDFPLAIAIDLWLTSRRRMSFFLGMLLLFEIPAFYLNVHVGGPYFLDHLLIPRRYSLERAMAGGFDYYMPLLIPMAAAVAAAMSAYRNSQRRILAIFLPCSFAVGMFFSGGHGVSINSYFSCTLAMAMLIGLFLHESGAPRWQWLSARWSVVAPLALFFWLLIPMQVNDLFPPWEQVKDLRASEHRFDQQVDFMRSHPGPALCESILRCYYAEKPYIVDPFNAVSLIESGKLDEIVLVRAIRSRQFSTIQFDRPPRPDGLPNAAAERFTPAVLEAVRDSYVPALRDSDATIYVPAPATELAHKMPLR